MRGQGQGNFPIFRRDPRAKSQYKSLRAERGAAKLKIVGLCPLVPKGWVASHRVAFTGTCPFVQSLPPPPSVLQKGCVGWLVELGRVSSDNVQFLQKGCVGWLVELGRVSSDKRHQTAQLGGGGGFFPNVRVHSIAMGISETIVIVTEQSIDCYGGQNFIRQDFET